MVQRDWFCLGVRLIGFYFASTGAILISSGILMFVFDKIRNLFDGGMTLMFETWGDPTMSNLIELVHPLVIAAIGILLIRHAERITDWVFRFAKREPSIGN